METSTTRTQGTMGETMNRRRVLIGGAKVAAGAVAAAGLLRTGGRAYAHDAATPEPAVEPFASGGLGLDIRAWEQQFGKGKVVQGGAAFYTIDGLAVAVQTRGSGAARQTPPFLITSIYAYAETRSDAIAPTFWDAVDLFRPFFPADAQPIEAFSAPQTAASPRPPVDVLLLRSASLEGRYPAGYAANTGNFVLIPTYADEPDGGDWPVIAADLCIGRGLG